MILHDSIWKNGNSPFQNHKFELIWDYILKLFLCAILKRTYSSFSSGGFWTTVNSFPSFKRGQTCSGFHFVVSVNSSSDFRVKWTHTRLFKTFEPRSNECNESAALLSRNLLFLSWLSFESAHFPSLLIFCPSPVAVVTSRGELSGRRLKGEREGGEIREEGKGGSYVGFLGKGTKAAVLPPCSSSSLFFFFYLHCHIFQSLQKPFAPDRSPGPLFLIVLP